MIYLFIGKSGAGKDTICKRHLSSCKSTLPIISFTTRPMRDGEVNGVDYHFVSNQEFQKMIDNDELTEYRYYDTEVNGDKDRWFYGTPKLDILKDYAGVVEIDGAISFVKCYGADNIDITLIVVDDIEREKRAKLRGGFDQTEWNRRMLADAHDFSEERIKNLEDIYGKKVTIYFN